MREVLPGWLWTAVLLSLSTNRLPWVTAGLLGAAVASSIRPPWKLLPALAGLLGAWVLLLAFTGEAAQVLAPAFHRRDGQLFVSMLPVVGIACLPGERTRILRPAISFAGLQAAAALAGVAADAAGAREALRGWIFLPDEGPDTLNYCAGYLAHNAAGSVQGLCAVTAFTLAALGEGTRFRWTWGLMGLVLCWGVVLSKSRGSLLAMAGACLILGFIAWRRDALSRRAWAGVAVALLATLAVLGPRMGRRLAELGAPSGTHTYRLDQWRRGIEEWTWSPLVGIGMGRYNDTDRTFSGVKGLVYVATGGTVVNDAGHAHNSYVHFLAEGGVLGLGVTVGFWAWIAWRLRGSREPLRVAAFLGVLYLVAISMTEHYMGGGAMLLLLSCLVGAAWSLPEPAEPAKIDPS